MAVAVKKKTTIGQWIGYGIVGLGIFFLVIAIFYYNRDKTKGGSSEFTEHRPEGVDYLAPVGDWSSQIMALKNECIRWRPKTPADIFETQVFVNNTWVTYRQGFPEASLFRFRSLKDTPSMINVVIRPYGRC